MAELSYKAHVSIKKLCRSFISDIFKFQKSCSESCRLAARSHKSAHRRHKAYFNISIHIKVLGRREFWWLRKPAGKTDPLFGPGAVMYVVDIFY